jgi:hypothetical protein
LISQAMLVALTAVQTARSADFDAIAAATIAKLDAHDAAETTTRAERNQRLDGRSAVRDATPTLRDAFVITWLRGSRMTSPARPESHLA